ncbi:MAG: hypothetical protein O3B04_08090 [Chloroflexi bacterium]|nr:hypothetical protein [Chloroflexota bacterium]
MAIVRILPLLLITVFIFAACSSPGTGDAAGLCEDCTPTALAVPESGPALTEASVKLEIVSQLFEEASRSVHVFGLNVEQGEEFVPSGRDRLPIPPDSSGWRAEYEGDGIWIVDTGMLIYRFDEADVTFEVIWDYTGRE